ncbi:MAG: NADH-quinone oxidoreductase subunit I [Prevotellaceae bacterium]|jgi:NADH-quinone oxidoreductase subunit I|nr:NADH-quinone oxidoreductase subunit I [Prevotellaceae bacterium]
MKQNSYIGGLLQGIRSLLTGMKTSMKVFWQKPTTEQYPENRGRLHISERFRGSLYMPVDEQGNHRCIACNLCQMACPNGTINIVSESVTTDEGKKKRVLVRYEYDLGSCIYCGLCVNACPHDAIRFNNSFEHSVFDRSKLVLTLNKQ